MSVFKSCFQLAFVGLGWYLIKEFLVNSVFVRKNIVSSLTLGKSVEKIMTQPFYYFRFFVVLNYD